MILERLQKEFADAVEARPAKTHDLVDGVHASAVAAPRGEEAALALVKWCGSNNVAFVPRGGGTKLNIGAPPARCDLIISTEHLNNIAEHDEGNATVQAGSGISLADLDQAVGERGQFVPFDHGNNSWDKESATLGGVVASNHFGATKLRYGMPRDLVVGLHAALSDGRLVKAGSKVVKNVSGYDLNKLFIGSIGTLGLITQVTIRLRPNDAAREEWQKTFTSWNDAEEAARQILDGAFEPAIVRISAHEDRYVLSARFDGSEAAVSAQMQRLPEAEPASSETGDEPELELRAQLPLTSAGHWARNAQETGATRVLWDAGLGVVRASWQDLPASTPALVHQLREATKGNNGFVVAERAPSEFKAPEFVWGEPRSDLALMQQLKKTFDAANVCAPGRFIGGI